MAPMVQYLQGLGLVVLEPPLRTTPVDVVLGDFEHYLLDERGLARDSVRSMSVWLGSSSWHRQR
jgi:hypothetical protein